MAIYPVQAPTTYLAGSGVIIGATTITVTDFVDIYGNVLTMPDFGSKGQGCLEPDTNNEEAVTFTGITVNANGTYTLTGVKTVLAKTPFTEASGLVREHAGGTKFVISDTAGFWAGFANKNNNEIITGKYTLPGDLTNRPNLSSDIDSSTATDLVTVGQLSRQAISGAANASTSVKGIVEAATQAEVDAKITTGGTGALLVATPDLVRSTLLSDYKADTGAANAYVITPVPAISAYTAGQIFSFKAINTNTGASTININGLGVKTIKKLGGTADLASGDIVAGQVVIVEYDGTNFQMFNQVNQYNSFFYGDGSDGDVTINSNTTLTRDMFYNNLTINSTFTLNTANYKIYVKGTLTNNGTIASNGSAGADGSAGGAGGSNTDGSIKGGASGGSASNAGSHVGGGGGSGGGVLWLVAKNIAVEGTLEAKGGAGGNGYQAGFNTGGGGGGVNGSSVASTYITSGTGGNGGSCGSGGFYAGGTGGTIVTTKISTKDIYNLYNLFDRVLSAPLRGGAGGGSGATNGAVAPVGGGGGGGGQGGVIIEIYNTLTTSGTKTVTGGAAGTGANTNPNGTAGSSGITITAQI